VLLDRIGTGRMAGVYKGRKGGQVVALKVLPPGKAKETETLARFQREGRLALRLKHPNVVRTFEFGQHDGLHFIAMECLEGETLEDVLLRRDKLPPDEVTRLLRQALEGLQHLHEQDVVHRDVKPANLVLVADASDGKLEGTRHATLKTLDDGLGKTLFDDVSESQADLTGAGDLLGTAACMAPEQARDARRADIRSDLYSLGCVAYHALAGQPPFVDSNATNVLMMHATRPPRPLREVDPAIPGVLAETVVRLLAKDPAQRFATPRAAIQSLAVSAGDRQADAQSAAPRSHEGRGRSRSITRRRGSRRPSSARKISRGCQTSPA
jgi:serine/threonine protein kinase